MAVPQLYPSCTPAVPAVPQLYPIRLPPPCPRAHPCYFSSLLLALTSGVVWLLAVGAPPKVLFVRVAQAVQQPKLGGPVQVGHRLHSHHSKRGRGKRGKRRMWWVGRGGVHPPHGRAWRSMPPPPLMPPLQRRLHPAHFAAQHVLVLRNAPCGPSRFFARQTCGPSRLLAEPVPGASTTHLVHRREEVLVAHGEGLGLAKVKVLLWGTHTPGSRA